MILTCCKSIKLCASFVKFQSIPNFCVVTNILLSYFVALPYGGRITRHTTYVRLFRANR